MQGDRTGDVPLNEVVKEYLRIKHNKPGEAYLGVVHRLDRPVSGVVLFAKTSKALSRLNEMFKNRDVTKTYWACVETKPDPATGSLEDFLQRNPRKNKSFSKPTSDKNTKKALLHYRLLASSDKYFLLEVSPETGRHHQIRVQLSSAGWPIKGDVKYGARRTNKDASIHLHARKLGLIHPVRKEWVEWEAPVPDDPVWKSVEKTVADTTA